MDLCDSPEEGRFRHELRSWLASVVPGLPPRPDPDDWPARRAYDTHWQCLLHDAGYAGVHWPREWGGRGATPAEHLIYLEETERAGAPYVGTNFVGLLHAGPTLMALGTPEQRARHLPRILAGEEVWCQGFSEPEAGSDLAALRTRAVRDGDEYVVTGHKVWTSHASVADYCELLVRTAPDAPRHRGISWLILPMDSPGVQVRPLRTLMGSAEFSEVFLDDVRIPVANRVGSENDGWRVAMVTFAFERGTAFAGEVVGSLVLAHELTVLARSTTVAGQPAWEDVGLRRELGRVSAELEALWALTRRSVSAVDGAVAGAGGSVLKLSYSQARQRLLELAAGLLGRAALSTDDLAPGVPGGSGRLVAERLHALSLTIAAGSSQIQRDIVAERILGLPRGRG
ncbi:MAG: acyl-CoA dehydrogenase family protein [Mycobacteriales bacterium]